MIFFILILLGLIGLEFEVCCPSKILKNSWPLFLQILFLFIFFLLSFLELQLHFFIMSHMFLLFFIFSLLSFCALVCIYSTVCFQFTQIWCYAHQLRSQFYLFLFFHYRISIWIFLWFLILYWNSSSFNFISWTY